MSSPRITISWIKPVRGLVAVILATLFLASPAIAATSNSDAAAAGDQTAEIASLGQAAVPLDLQQAIMSAEAASLAIFDGLETTQNLIGKTERRKAAIEHGRNHASGRLNNLIERARSADSYRDLAPTDRLVLKRLLGQQ